MTLLEKLDRRARDVQVKVMASLTTLHYEQQAADDRELLEAAAKRIRELEARCQP